MCRCNLQGGRPALAMPIPSCQASADDCRYMCKAPTSPVKPSARTCRSLHDAISLQTCPGRQAMA